MGRNQISEGRKVTYYIGLGLLGLGIVLIMSTFLSVALFMARAFSTFGSHGGPNFGVDQGMSSIGFAFARGFIGFILIIIGSVVSGIGRMGAAGSGLKLDPDQAREDLKPWNKMRGGMINDTLSQIDVVSTIADRLTPEHEAHEASGAAPSSAEIIKVRCPACRALNDETAKFCSQCGKPL